MEFYVVVDNPKKWNFNLDDLKIISAKEYITDSKYIEIKHIRIINLCKSYSYQSLGYYVSLLASARKHIVIPEIPSIQNMKYLSILRTLSDDLEKNIQSSLNALIGEEFTLSIYFGKNLAKKYDSLSNSLFSMFHAPLMKAEFKKIKGNWKMNNISAISINNIPEPHYDFFLESLKTYIKYPYRRNIKSSSKYDLAILTNPHEKFAPSNKAALKKFQLAGKKLGLKIDFIDKEDYSDLPYYDALFIRETTNVNNHTYRFSRMAKAEGLVVIDDPESIEKCANKVFLAELLNKNNIPCPKTIIINKDNVESVKTELGFPCIIKIPDSAFSQGVFKATDENSLNEYANLIFKDSDLFIAQEYIKTDFDWRIGIIDRQILFVCKYYMAHKHWQIAKTSEKGRQYVGKHDTIPINKVPEKLLKIALKAANLIGNGFYGVDIKQVDDKFYLIEVNDNPNVDHGVEDEILKDDLYLKIISVFLEKIEKKKLRKAV